MKNSQVHDLTIRIRHKGVSRLRMPAAPSNCRQGGARLSVRMPLAAHRTYRVVPARRANVVLQEVHPSVCMYYMCSWRL